MKQMLTIVPSRGRQENHKELVELFKETSTISDLCFGLDSDDYQNYEQIDGVIYEINDPIRMNGTLNLIANRYAKEYEFLCFIGDDHRPRTPGWDKVLVEPLRGSIGLSYGNDLLQGKNLATAVVMTSNIVKELGFFAPPQLKHFYLDNFWMDLGRALDKMFYFDDVIIEHMHPLNQKSEVDDTYNHAWSILGEDQGKYDEYKRVQFDHDFAKLEKYL